MVLIGIALIGKDSASSPGQPLLYLGSLHLVVVFSVVAHELGHALAALMVGARLFRINIGLYGRVVFSRRVFRCRFVVRSILYGGNVLCAPKGTTFFRLRYAVVLLGGPLANVLLMVLGQWAFSRFSQDNLLSSVLAAVVHGNLFLLVISGIPRRMWIEGSRGATDGLALLSIPFMTREAIKAAHSAVFYYELMDALEQRDIEEATRWLTKGTELVPDEGWLLFGRASILSAQRQYQEARDVYLKALGESDMASEAQGYVWNNIAWESLMTGESALLAEADQFSRQAYAELPSVSPIKGTRGSVLIELGHLDEGAPLVEQALRENHQPSHRALNACYLAIAMAKRGDTSKAQKYAEQAERLDPQCPLLERVTAVEGCDSPGTP